MKPYFPPVALLCQALGITTDEIYTSDKVTVNVAALRKLVEVALGNVSIDTSVYAAQNPDIESSLGYDTIKLNEHFIKAGYFEGRAFPWARFDTAFYLKAYADIAAAYHSKTLGDPFKHFQDRGVYEARLPNSTCQNEVDSWWEIINQNGQAG